METESHTKSVVTVTYQRTQLRGFTIAVVLFVALCGGTVRGQDGPQRNVVLIFVDDLHIDFSNTPKLRTGLQQATDRLLASGASVGLVSDGTSAIVIQPTPDGTPIRDVARRILGSGLKPSEVANATPVIAAEVARREAAAQTTLQRTIDAMPP